MPKLLENLVHGTPVLSSMEGVLGEVRGVFALGETRIPECLLILWNDTKEETLLDADEVLSISDDGVVLRSGREMYKVLPGYDPQTNPLLKRLS
ncbi:MAG TPA: hypothetical protein VFW34_09935 [Candidatus Rubrimentiphilum sp.]|nr:hypothetical protein [Candidatus Rubrimentiphilum sp.]